MPWSLQMLRRSWANESVNEAEASGGKDHIDLNDYYVYISKSGEFQKQFYPEILDKAAAPVSGKTEFILFLLHSQFHRHRDQKFTFILGWTIP